MNNRSLSTLAIAGGLTAFGLLALAAVLLIQPGPESTSRLGLFFGICSTVVVALVSALRAEQAQKQTNGSLDERIEAGVYRAQNARRRQVEKEQNTPGENTEDEPRA